MQRKVLEQLSESEYKTFGTLFRCSDTEALTSKLTSVLEKNLLQDKRETAKNIATKVHDVFSTHLEEIEVYTDFYENPESEGYERGKEINDERIRSENDFDKKSRYFEQIKNRCDRHKKQTDKIGYNINSTIENRKEYPLYPPSEFLTQEDISALEKFLHWKVFLSSDNKEDPDVGNPYLYIDLTSKIGAGGLDIAAQNHNNILIEKLTPTLSETGLSVKKMAIIIWAHQYFVSECYYWRHEHSKNFFIPALTSLVKDVDKNIKNKT